MKGLNDDFQGATPVKASLQNSLEAVRKLQQRVRMAFVLCCVVQREFKDTGGRSAIRTRTIGAVLRRI